jgi:hypothetical protein
LECRNRCRLLGRYLYDLDKTWVDLDQYNRPVHTPNLPDWAVPGYAQRDAQRQATRNQRTEPRQSLVRDEILAKVRELREKVGYSLSVFVLNKYAGGAEPDKVGHAKLTTVFEKLTDIGNGIDRLRRAAAIVGDANQC